MIKQMIQLNFSNKFQSVLVITVVGKYYALLLELGSLLNHYFKTNLVLTSLVLIFLTEFQQYMLMVLSGTYFIICVYGTSVTKFNVNCFYLVFIPFALPIKNEIYFQKTIIIPVTTGGFELRISNIRSRYLTH